MCQRCNDELNRGKKATEDYIAQFSERNLMQPCEIPPELQGLTTIEKVVIKKVTPMMQVYTRRCGKKGLRGNTIAFMQDLQPICNVLPRLPENIPCVVLQSMKHENLELNIRPQKVLDALRWLKKNNRYYADIEISETNLGFYEEKNGSFGAPVLNFAFEPKEVEVLADEEEPLNELLNFEESDLKGDWPEASSIVMDSGNGKNMDAMIREAIAGKKDLTDTPQDQNSEVTPSSPSAASNALPNEEMMDTSDVDAAMLSDPPGNPDVDILEAASDNQVKIDFPERSKVPVFEFVPGYYSMSFPELFPTGVPEFTTVSREWQTKHIYFSFSLPFLLIWPFILCFRPALGVSHRLKLGAIISCS